MHSNYHPELDAWVVYTYNNPNPETDAQLLHELHPDELILFMNEYSQTSIYYNPKIVNTTGNRVNLIVNGELKRRKR
jgi:hypothetical protein